MRKTGVIALFVLASCSAPQQRSAEGDGPDPRERADVASGQREEPASSQPGTVTRGALFRLLGGNPGHFFGVVEVEGVGTEEGTFVGWQITRLPSRTPGWLDVRVGDVVVAVNGLTVERPEDAQRIYETMRVASEVRIDLTRDGEARSVRIEILDTGEPLPPFPAEQRSDTPVPPAAEEPGHAGPPSTSTARDADTVE